MKKTVIPERIKIVFDCRVSPILVNCDNMPENVAPIKNPTSPTNRNNEMAWGRSCSFTISLKKAKGRLDRIVDPIAIGTKAIKSV